MKGRKSVSIEPILNFDIPRSGWSHERIHEFVETTAAKADNTDNTNTDKKQNKNKGDLPPLNYKILDLVIQIAPHRVKLVAHGQESLEGPLLIVHCRLDMQKHRRKNHRLLQEAGRAVI